MMPSPTRRSEYSLPPETSSMPTWPRTRMTLGLLASPMLRPASMATRSPAISVSMARSRKAEMSAMSPRSVVVLIEPRISPIVEAMVPTRPDEVISAPMSLTTVIMSIRPSGPLTVISERLISFMTDRLISGPLTLMPDVRMLLPTVMVLS